MVFSWSSREAEENGRLLVRLKEKFGAKEIGDIHGFFETESFWKCRCCFRTKERIARLDKNGALICRIVRHHDHFADMAHSKIPREAIDHGAVVVSYSFARFDETLICQDCNTADAAAKVIVNAPKAFSFSPCEITGFIIVKDNQPHEINKAAAERIYASVVPQMEELAARLRSTIAAGRSDVAPFEPVQAAAWRVLMEARRKMRKDAAE